MLIFIFLNQSTSYLLTYDFTFVRKYDDFLHKYCFWSKTNTREQSERIQRCDDLSPAGWVQFRSADAKAKASNLLLWELHTFKDFNMAKPPKDPFPHQILLESKDLPTSLENPIIMKDFFKNFLVEIGNNIL